jgi:hypothetical protein
MIMKEQMERWSSRAANYTYRAWVSKPEAVDILIFYFLLGNVIDEEIACRPLNYMFFTPL